MGAVYAAGNLAPMPSFNRTRSTVVVALLLVVGTGVLLFAQSTKAQPPTDRDAALEAEIAAVQRDVAGTTPGAERLPPRRS
jgi:hypothetical protein